MLSTNDITEMVPDPPRRRTIQEELSKLGEIHSLEEFMTKYQEAEFQIGRSEIVSDLVTWKLDRDKVYLFENCSSIYSLLGTYRYRGLPSDKSSIHGALKRGSALVELTGPDYYDYMIHYLQDLGSTHGRGSFDPEGRPLGFNLDDFILHRTKLPLLLNLVKARVDPEEPQWSCFFDSSYAEYKAYVFGKLKKNPGGTLANEEARRPSQRPGGVSPRSPKDKGISSLDPFSDVSGPMSDEDFSLPERRRSKPKLQKLPLLGLDKLPMGTIPLFDWFLRAGAEERNRQEDQRATEGH